MINGNVVAKFLYHPTDSQIRLVIGLHALNLLGSLCTSN
jgi:hypothetical protein